ncbi:MAG: molybdenum cofactor biosynthesis protein MoaE [Tepidisphaeraceae bacterium]
MDDWIDILAAPLDIAAAYASVTHPDAGGVDVFVGTTRAEARPDGVALLALDYEAYTEMAIEQLKTLRDEAKRRWPICRVAILHRVGRVEVGQPSVVIATSCPHRAESFEATRFLIDELKKVAAIWKKDVWADGRAQWK